MHWTQKKLEHARRILWRNKNMGKAHDEICFALGESVSKTSVRAAFQRAGFATPYTCLGVKVPPGNWDLATVARFNDYIPGSVTETVYGKPAPSKATTRILVVSDLHVPYHDVRAWECVLEAIRVTKPETVVLIGDTADVYSISSHPKSLDRKQNFASEVEAVNRELDRLREVAGESCRIIWTCGNHEDRITRFLQSNAPELAGISAVRAEALFRVNERGIEWVPYRRHIKIGNCSFTHDVGRCGVNAARQSLLDFGGNIVFGHSHRGATVYQGESKGSSHFAMNVGWLGDVNEVDYMHRCRATRDWQLGFGIVDQDAEGFSWAHFCPIVDGRCIVDGTLISGKVAA